MRVLFVKYPTNQDVQYIYYMYFTNRIPDVRGWCDKATRIAADELAFSTQAIVLMPALDHSPLITEGKEMSLLEETLIVQGTRLQRWNLNNKQLNLLIDVIRFARSEFESQSISLVGFGYGGGFVLEAATEISTLVECYRRFLDTDGVDNKNAVSSQRKLEFSTEQRDDLHKDEERNSRETPVQVGAAVIIGK